MKCLTICQPYAHLIITPQDELPPGQVQKRVENRKWDTSYRGELLIHAGKSKKYLDDGDLELFRGMVFGAILGVVTVVDCVPKRDDLGFAQYRLDARPWLKDHIHAEGPFCFVLENPRRFETPIPYLGLLGFFEVPNTILPAEFVPVKKN